MRRKRLGWVLGGENHPGLGSRGTGGRGRGKAGKVVPHTGTQERGVLFVLVSRAYRLWM